MSAIGYLLIGETLLEAWRPDVAFNHTEVKTALDEECLHLPIPGPNRNMQGDFENHNCFSSCSHFS